MTRATLQRTKVRDQMLYDRALASWALVLGSPCLAALISLALLVPAVPLGPASSMTRAAQIAGVLNAALAACGASAGGLLTGGAMPRRVVAAVAAGLLGAAAYFVLLSTAINLAAGVLW